MLNRHNLLEQIRRIQEEAATGFLSLGQDDKVVTVYFREGLISAVSTNVPEHRLGRYLSRKGFVADSDVNQLLDDAQKLHIRVGEAAVAQKLLDGTDLEEVVREQAIQVLTHALLSDFEVRGFTHASQTFATPAGIDLSHVMLELARTNLKPLQLEPNRVLALSNGTQPSQLPLYPQEFSVMTQLAQPRTVQDLATVTGLEYSRVTKILSVLDALDLIKIVDQPAGETAVSVHRERFPFEALTPEMAASCVDEKVQALREESSYISEQFRSLKIRIAEVAQSRDHPIRVIAVTSPEAQDGKSLVAVNLAISCSMDPGHRAIIVDCDLRNPSLHKYLGASVDPGLLGYLQSEYLQPYGYMRRLNRLYTITAGGTAANPVEMLSLGKMKALLDHLKTEFDIVILDAPPMAPISDAQILTSISDGMVAVVRCGKTSYPALERGFRNLDRGKLLGVVFNGVRSRMFNTLYNQRYYRSRYQAQGPPPQTPKAALLTVKT